MAMGRERGGCTGRRVCWATRRGARTGALWHCSLSAWASVKSFWQYVHLWSDALVADQRVELVCVQSGLREGGRWGRWWWEWGRRSGW